MWLRRKSSDQPIDSKKSLAEATQRLEEAEKQLERIKARDPEVKEVAGTSRWIRRENNFSGMLTDMLLAREGGKGR